MKPVSRIYHAMASIPPNNGVMLLGGFTEHKWSMDLFDVWLLKPTQNPEWKYVAKFEPGDSHEVAFDVRSRRLILLNLSGDTWVFSPDTAHWKRMNVNQGPSGRCGHRLVYDKKHKCIILFGGFGGRGVEDPPQNDTWVYDCEANTWQEMKPKVSPPVRIFHSMAYDEITSRVVMWGGRTSDLAVWSYDYSANEWLRHDEIIGGPLGVRAYHSMTYMPELGGLVVFGGVELQQPHSFEGNLCGDTWLLSLADAKWKKLDVENAPSPRSHHAAVYDPGFHRLVLFGGELKTPYSGIVTDELWAFNPQNLYWTRLSLPPK